MVLYKVRIIIIIIIIISLKNETVAALYNKCSSKAIALPITLICHWTGIKTDV